MILMRIKSFYLAGAAALLALTLTLAGCKVESGLKFSHKFHITEQEVTCGECHVAESGNYQAPSMDVCAECHEIDVDNPSQDCLLCHTIDGAKNDYEVKESKKPRGFSDLSFDHEVHADYDCTTCHSDIPKEAGLENGPSMTLCLNCHKEVDGPQECSACHQEITAEKAPHSHQQDWESRHGQASKLDTTCVYCHTNRQAFCENCHRTQKPRDHVFGWKIGSHGMEAGHNRRLCSTCHDAGYCIDCHTQQKPVSHKRGDWMSYSRENGHAEAAMRNFRSCNVCHETGQCMQCHNTIILRKD